MDLQKDEYIIVEIIPTRSSSKEGFIAQLSALKLKGIQLLDRFDYRVEDRFIENEDLKNMIQYDKEQFTYVNNIYFIIEKFRQWAKDYPFLLLENTYTLDFLKDFKNKKELIYPYFGLDFHPNVFSDIIEKYHLEPSPHLVDLLYEAIIYEGNNKK